MKPIVMTCAALCVFLARFTLTSAAEQQPIAIHVDAGRGNDSNPGTSNAPVKSLPRAIELSRQKSGAKGITLAAGRYQLDAPLLLDRDSDLTVAGDPQAATIISGGRAITGWKRVGDLLQAELPEVREGKWRFRELFVGNERRRRARTPNEGFYLCAEVGADKRTSFSFKEGELKAWRGVENLELVFLHDWSVSRIKFARIDESSSQAVLADPVGPDSDFFAMDSFESHPRYFVENSLDLLDAPGEWFLDEQTGILSYKPRDGEKPESLEVFAPFLEALVVVRGDADANRPQQKITFENLVFEHCRWTPPSHGYAESQATKYALRDSPTKQSELMPAAITFDQVAQCLIRNCTLRHLGGSGIWFRRECIGNGLEQCIIDDVAGNGINLGETFTRRRTDAKGTMENSVSRANRVTDCRVSRCGEFSYGAVGIWIGIAAETTIARNEISQLPYTGISVGWKWDPSSTGAEKNLIESNHIHHVMQLLSDGGGVYTLGRQPGSALRRNHIHDVPVNLGRAESNGFFMDEGSSEFLVEENVIYATARSPIRFHQALQNTLRRNHLAHADDLPMFRYNSTDPKSMMYESNSRLGDSKGQYSPSGDVVDAIIKEAGPR